MVNNKSVLRRNFTGAYEIEVDSRVSEVTLRKGDPKGYFDSLYAYKGKEVGYASHAQLIVLRYSFLREYTNLLLVITNDIL